MSSNEDRSSRISPQSLSEMEEKSSSNSRCQGLDYWRTFFKGSNANIIDIIEKAIIIAGIDFPNDLTNNRSKIIEMLFSPCCRLNHIVSHLAEEEKRSKRVRIQGSSNEVIKMVEMEKKT